MSQFKCLKCRVFLYLVISHFLSSLYQIIQHLIGACTLHFPRNWRNLYKNNDGGHTQDPSLRKLSSSTHIVLVGLSITLSCCSPNALIDIMAGPGRPITASPIIQSLWRQSRDHHSATAEPTRVFSKVLIWMLELYLRDNVE